MSEARAVGLHVVRELEMLKAWCREQDLNPPRQFIMAEEADDKGLSDVVEVIPFSQRQT